MQWKYDSLLDKEREKDITGASNFSGQFVQIIGDTMTGPLGINLSTVNALEVMSGTSTAIQVDSTRLGIGVGTSQIAAPLTLGQGNSGIVIYNTVNPNAEFIQIKWTGNIASVRTMTGISGTARDATFGTQNRQLFVRDTGNPAFYDFSTSTGTSVETARITNVRSNTSGVPSELMFALGGSQSGTAGYNVIGIGVSLGSLGSGPRSFTRFVAQGVTYHFIDDQGNQFNAGFMRTGGNLRTTAQFDKTDVLLAGVTGLGVTLSAGRNYSFRSALFVDASTIGGQKYALGSSVSQVGISSIIFQVNSISNSLNTNVITSRGTSLLQPVGQAGSNAYYTEINGLISVSSTGFFSIQFAQNSASTTSSVLPGSFMTIDEVT